MSTSAPPEDRLILVRILLFIKYINLVLLRIVWEHIYFSYYSIWTHKYIIPDKPNSSVIYIKVDFITI